MKTLLSFIFGLAAINAAAQSPILRGPGTTNTPSNWTNVVRVIATNSLSHASKLTPGGVLPPLDGAALTNANPTNLFGAGVIPMAKIATGTPTGSKFVRDDGTLQLIPGGGDALTSNPLSQFAATTSSQLRGVLTDESGTGVFLTANGDGSGLTGVNAATGMQTNQFTTNVVGQPVIGRILLGSTGSMGADFQLRSTNVQTSVNFGDQAMEDRFRLFSSAATGFATFRVNSTNTGLVIAAADSSPGTGGYMGFRAAQDLNTLLFAGAGQPFAIQDELNNEWMRVERFSGVLFLRSTNILTLRAPTVTVTNNLNVGGTLNVSSMNVTQMVLVNLSNNYAYVSGNGTLTTTNNGLGWTNIQSSSIVSNGTLLTMTALGFDSPTNLWVANTSFGLGTNYTAVQAAGTVGITGIANKSTTTERYGQLVMLATGTVTFTNVAGIKCNDGVLTRTITNGNSATIAIDFVPGVVTNLFIVQTW